MVRRPQRTVIRLNTQLDSGRRWAILGSVMLGLFLSAMDQTVVGTAMPRIIAELSGLKLYAWVFTSYMLCSTTFVPIIGKVGDTYGRKNLFLAGIAIFLAGSILSGTSRSMVQLIVFRGVQGIGGGFIFANAFAIIGDLYAPAERGRYAGIMSSVFGLASVIGPLIGGWITDNLTWRWVFYVNIPLGIAAFAVLAIVLPAGQRRGPAKPVDYLGAATLAGAVAPMLLAFSWAGTDYGWTSPQVVTPLIGSTLMFAAFVLVEQRAADPIVPFSLFRNRVFAVCTAATFVSGAGMFAGSVYIPLFMQGVLKFSATNAGLVLTPMMISLVIASALGGQLISRTGRYKWMTVAGFCIATSGLFLLSLMDAGSSRYWGMGSMAVLGFGLGMSFPSLSLASQNAFPHALLGVSTSLNQFSRSVGGTIGVAIMGSLLTRRLHHELATTMPQRVQQEAPAPLLDAVQNPRLLLDHAALEALRDRGFTTVFGADGSSLFDATVASMRTALATSITDVFLVATAVMSVAIAIVIFLPELPLRRTIDVPSAFETPPGAER